VWYVVRDLNEAPFSVLGYKAEPWADNAFLTYSNIYGTVIVDTAAFEMKDV
jgi:hypothetical protein